ncbi:MAG: PH domain-containing protein [Bacteroidetes bacterium]|nr:PH domain-containing protein [Bacteroidota bacterium]
MKINFENDQIEIEGIPDYESVSLQSVSPKYLKVLLFNTGVFSVFLLSLFLGVFLYWNKELAPYALLWFGIALLLVILVFIYFLLEFKYRKFALRQHDIIYQHGLLAQTIIFVPLNKIQHIEIDESWLSRYLGLASISLYTGSSGNEVTITGLPKEEAQKIYSYIFIHTQIESNLPEAPLNTNANE